MTENHNRTRILGIDFFTGTMEESLEAISEGGLVVAPAAPALAVIDVDRLYYQSIREADVILTDSGFMVLLWLLLQRKKIPRHSGLKFLEALLKLDGMREPGASYWIMPGEADDRANREWLKTIGIVVEESDRYLAPMYDSASVTDPVLLEELERKKPPFVVINIGGGTQEKLGYYLHRQLSYRPAIICTGAAIAFLSGQQANIPAWIDRVYLGWFLRCLQAPKKFIPRYWLGRKILGMLVRHGEDEVPENPEIRQVQ